MLGTREQNKLVGLLPKEAIYVGVGVGKRWNKSFMTEAAANSGGYFTHINPDESATWRTMELLASLNSPRLLDLKVQSNDGEVDFLLNNKIVLHGEQLCAIARLKPDQSIPKSVQITGRVDGDEFSRRIACKP